MQFIDLSAFPQIGYLKIYNYLVPLLRRNSSAFGNLVFR